MQNYIPAPEIPAEVFSQPQGPSTTELLAQQGGFPTVIDNTIRSAYTKCPEYFFRSFVQNLRIKGTSIHLHAGGAFAHALEHARKAFWQNKVSPLEAEQIGLHALYDYYTKEEELEPAKNGDKSLEGMVRAYESYMLEYPLGQDYIVPHEFDNGEFGIEFSFAAAIPELVHPETGNPFLFSGRFDLLGDYNKMLFVCDEKTTTSLGEQWRNNWDLDSQFTGYCWGARSYGHPVVGAIARGIGLLKTKTTHQEVIIYRPDWQVDRWLRDLQYQLSDMIRDWKRKYYRFALDKAACNSYGGCPMKMLCESPEPEQWLDSHYQVIVWDPLAKR